MSIREKFVEDFGEDQASRIEEAAVSHANGVNSKNKGSDPFKWALAIAIGYQCMEVDSYRSEHKITVPFTDLKNWIIMNGELASHDGDYDYINMMVGGYDEYLPRSQNKEKMN